MNVRKRNNTSRWELRDEAYHYARSIGGTHEHGRQAGEIVAWLVKSMNTDRIIRMASKDLIFAIIKEGK